MAVPSDTAPDSVPVPSNVHVAGICGSLSTDSSTRRALQIALGGAAGGGALTTLVDLRDLKLPFAGTDWTAQEFPDVARFNGIVRAADALIWATPEYHGSFTGALKNALDLGYEEYEGKMVALIGVAGGAIGAINALSHLRTVARQLHAWVLPRQVSIASAGKAFDEQGQLLDTTLQKALEALGTEVAKYARLHATLRD